MTLPPPPTLRVYPKQNDLFGQGCGTYNNTEFDTTLYISNCNSAANLLDFTTTSHNTWLLKAQLQESGSDTPGGQLEIYTEYIVTDH